MAVGVPRLTLNGRSWCLPFLDFLGIGNIAHCWRNTAKPMVVTHPAGRGLPDVECAHNGGATKTVPKKLTLSLALPSRSFYSRSLDFANDTGSGRRKLDD